MFDKSADSIDINETKLRKVVYDLFLTRIHNIK